MEIAPRQIERKFDQLRIRWRRETKYKSSLHDIINHPSYQEIISMGQPVLPLLLYEMVIEPTHWFVALHEVSGVNLNSSEDSFDEAVKKWITWGKDNNLICPED